MHIFIMQGSRSCKGQTAQATWAFLTGANRQGATCEVDILPVSRVERCRQCGDDGWGICRTQGKCVIDDDFASLVEKIRKADAVVFATPVYFGDLSESLRAFLDRLRRTCMHSHGKFGIQGKPAVGICVAGGGGGGAPACTVSLERVLATCGFDVVDMVPVRRQNLQSKVEVLTALGKQIACPKQKKRSARTRRSSARKTANR
jgi:multimeric flavodoxin WrbA